jgi:hypothetical protein
VDGTLRHIRETTVNVEVRESLGIFLLVVAFPLVNGLFGVHYMCCTQTTFRLGVRHSSSTNRVLALVLARSSVQGGHQVAVGGAGGGAAGGAAGGEFVVAVLEVLASVE